MSNIGKIVAEGLKIVDPTVKGVDLIQALSEYVHQKNIEKMDRINGKLLNNEASEYEKEKILNGGINTEDYLSFIKASVNDDESQKETLYITLYRNILNGKVKEGKGRLYKILKELPYSATQLLPIIYIHQHYEVQNETLEQYILEITTTDHLAFEINLLIQFGILKNIQQRNSVISNGSNITLNSSFDSIVTSFFKKDELIPKAHNIKIFKDEVLLLSDINDDNTYNEINYITKLLSKHSLKVNVNCHFEANHENKFNTFLGANFKGLYEKVAICYFDRKPLSIKSIKSLIDLSNKTYIIKVSLDNEALDPIPDKGSKLIYLKKDSKENEDILISQISEYNSKV